MLTYSVARWVAGPRGLLVIAVLLVDLTGDYLFTDPRSHSISDVFFVLALLAPPFVLGKVTRRLAEQSELLERQQGIVKREAARAERDRIARELHDVIAHSVSAMVVQAAAAQDLVRQDPSRAEAILAQVTATGRQALSETGQLLHVLRDADDELGLTPTPGLSEVPALVDRFRRDGLDVRASLDDLDDLVPTAVDVSSYRIVQEALTNALRYAADRTVDLSVAVRPHGVSITASNDAPTPRPPPRSRQRTRAAGTGRAGVAARWATHSRGVGRPLRARGRAADRDGDVRALCVVVADDQDLVRTGLEMVLSSRGVDVVGLAADGREAVALVRGTAPDVVLMDIRMPVMDGIAATREVVASASSARVLVLTADDLDSYLYDALRAAASGFLLKATPPDRLVDGIHTVAGGEALLAPSLTRRLIEEHVRRPAPVDGVPAPLRVLSARELEVFELIARGLSNDEICRSLVLSEATVKTHVNRILAKLGGLTRAQLVVLAYETGLVVPGSVPSLAAPLTAAQRRQYR